MTRWYKGVGVALSLAYATNFLTNSALAFSTGLEIKDRRETATIEERLKLEEDLGTYIKNAAIPFYGTITRDEE